MISSCWRAASSVFLASSSEMLAICTLASPLTKKQQSKEPETMVSLWFVQGKKKVLITRQGEKWRGHTTTSLEGESPSSSMGLVCPEEEPTPSCDSQGQYGSLIHCLESPPQRKSGRLWRSAQRHHAKQKVTLTNSTCPIQTYHR